MTNIINGCTYLRLKYISSYKNLINKCQLKQILDNKLCQVKKNYVKKIIQILINNEIFLKYFLSIKYKQIG